MSDPDTQGASETIDLIRFICQRLIMCHNKENFPKNISGSTSNFSNFVC